MRFTLSLPPRERLPAGAGNHLDFSPDGTHITYTAVREASVLGNCTWDRSAASRQSRYTSTEGGGTRFFSPDGQWVDLRGRPQAEEDSRRRRRSGYLVRSTKPPRSQLGAERHDRIYRRGQTTGNMAGLASGGTPTLLVAANPEQRITPSLAAIASGSRAILFASTTAAVATADEKSIEVLTVETGQRKVLIQGGSYPAIFLQGTCFLRSGTLMAVPFNLDQLEVTGPPVPVD